MQCFCCKGEMKDSTTVHFVSLKKCMVIIKNVPCVECVQCGEKYYTDTITERLDEIVAAIGGLTTELAVVDFTGKVA